MLNSIKYKKKNIIKTINKDNNYIFKFISVLFYFEYLDFYLNIQNAFFYSYKYFNIIYFLQTF